MRFGVPVRVADGDVAKAEIGALDLQSRCLVGRRPQPLARGRARALDLRRHHVGRMQAGAVGGIDRSLEHLRPIASDAHLDDARADRGCGRPRGRLEFAHLVGGTHPDPDETTGLAAGICLLLHRLRCAAGLAVLGWPVDDVAFDVNLPPVVQAAKAALLVASQGKRRAPVRAVFIHHAEPAPGVTKRHEVFAEQTNPHGCSVRIRHFFGHARGDPVTPHQRAHRAVAFDTAKEIVLFSA